MAELPQGTVTLLFTDIEGSTRLLHTLGDAYEDALATHRSLLRDALLSHGGVEVDTQGDAFFYGFPRATDAVTAAIEAQRALAAHPWQDHAPVRVRMGLHTGEPHRSVEGYVGRDVHLAARICGAAWGGQILVSSSTKDLIDDTSRQGVGVRDFGEHALKDITGRVRLYQLEIEGLRTDFPPPRTRDAHPTNLPLLPAPLIGREEEVAQLITALREGDARVVTLTGPGGTGKTRLALEVGHELRESFSDGVFSVDLSALTDASLVVAQVAAALGLKESGGRSLAAALHEYLSSKQILLLIDNFEQVMDAAPEVASLLSVSPGVRVLVTSREPLRIGGEQEVSVPPLSVPSHGSPLEEAEHSPAVALFVARARKVRADFVLTVDNAGDVAAICRRLDGLPLALELAAARVKVLSPRGLLERLDHSLKVLSSGRRDATERQRTLTGAIAWSYDLLSRDEQRLFSRLGVFAGGWSLGAAEQICAQGDLDSDVLVLDGLASLADKSLVRAIVGYEERFSMLETIREFGLEKLEQSGDAEEVRRAHAEFFGKLAEEAEPHLIGPDQKRWLDRLGLEQSNIRAALDWTWTHDTQLFLGLSSSAWRFWYTRGHLTEGQQRLEQGLRAADERNTRWAAKALRALAVFLDRQGNYDKAHSAAEESLAIYRGIGDEMGASDALEALAIVAENRGDFTSAETYFGESLRICEEAGDKRGAAFVANNLADLAMNQGAWEVAKAVFEDNLQRFRDLHDDEGVAWTSINLAVAVRKTDPPRAHLLLKEGLVLTHDLGDRELIAYCFEALASVTADRNPLLALRLLTKGAHLYEETGIRPKGQERAMHDETVSRLRRTISESQWDAAVKTGRSAAVDELMTELDGTLSYLD
jgi:predicted ATPase/class 3 adenylate cyclase